MSYFRFINKNPRTLFGIIRYVKDDEKICLPMMYGFNVNPETAFEEMDAVKLIWNKTGGRQYKHFVFSFDSDIVLSQQAIMNIGYKIGCYYADEYQILMVVHFNTSNTHIHYVLNTVNMVNGKKFSMTKRDEYNYKLYINKVLKEYRLSMLDLHDSKIRGEEVSA